MQEISERKMERGVPTTQAPTDPYQTQLLNLVNDLRKSKRKPPLMWDNRLGTAASGHVQDLITYGWNSPDPHNAHDVDWVKRIEQAGYTQWFALRENAAMNSGKLSPKTVEAMFKQLKRSPPHLANMLATDIRDFGTAVGQGTDTPSYCIMDFGRR